MDLALVFVVFALAMAALVWPGTRIVRKSGRSAWWALLIVIPVVNVIGIWVLAFARWPARDGQQ